VFGPEHLSCYLLGIEPGTPFGRRASAGTLVRPDEETTRGLFLATSDHLRARGYEHYEVSNFARGPAWRSRHNGKYWRRAPYLGLGPAAHSFQGRERWWNVRSLAGYLAALGAGRAPVAGSETLTDDQVALEEVYLGLRCVEGVALARVLALPAGHVTVDALVAEGLACVAGERLVATSAGYVVSDGLPARFGL
jgi:oxygen-independent coproporphyrinogen-3 oxidase